MKKLTVINLFGGPGVGKSTTTAGIFTLLKLHNVECELVAEFAKDLVWEERFKTFQNQQYIFGKQYHRVWRLQNKVDLVITDCPLFLNIVYGIRNGSISNKFIANVMDMINTFNNHNILLTRTKAYNPNGRNENEEEAIEVDNLIRQCFVKYKIAWMEVPGNFEAINDISKKFITGEQLYKITGLTSFVGG